MTSRTKSLSDNSSSIVIVDDHPVLREGLRKIIDQEDDLMTCGSVGTVREALDLLPRTSPDLVLTDLSFPESNGIELIKASRRICPELPVLVISMHDELLYAERVLRAGGRGFVPKEASMGVLLEAVRCVLDGGIFVTEVVASSFQHGMSIDGNSTVNFPLQRLTPRETEVFRLIGDGRESREIADALNISMRTVDAHRCHIREKLGIEDGSALTRFAMRWIGTDSVRGQ